MPVGPGVVGRQPSRELERDCQEAGEPLLPPPVAAALRPQQESGAAKMRKYYKLALVVVTLVSLVFLVFYKTQYDKLYNVLQVLEFFGQNGEAPPKEALRSATKPLILCLRGVEGSNSLMNK